MPDRSLVPASEAPARRRPAAGSGFAHREFETNAAGLSGTHRVRSNSHGSAVLKQVPDTNAGLPCSICKFPFARQSPAAGRRLAGASLAGTQDGRQKNPFKRNQVMITALAIMIAVAGYLNFAGTQIGEEELVSAGAENTDGDMEALLELSDEDLAADIPSLDSDTEGLAAENYLDADMQADNADVSIVTDYIDEEAAEAGAEASAQEAEVPDGEIPGEAVFTNSEGLNSLSGARLLKEQTRAKNKETLLEIINNANIAESQKQEAVDNMIELTDVAERETAAEILLESKGFADAVVTVTEDSADVVVGISALTDAQCAQIEDVVARKTGVPAENIVINPLAGQ